MNLRDCIRKLRYLHLRAHQQPNTISFRRYSKEANHQVTTINPLLVDIESLFALDNHEKEGVNQLSTPKKRFRNL